MNLQHGMASGGPSHLRAANILNLTSFWKACGAEKRLLPSGRVVRISSSWPSRLWLEEAGSPSEEDRRQILQLMQNRPLVMPDWPALNRPRSNGQKEGDSASGWLQKPEFQLKMTQELMVASMEAFDSLPASQVPWQPVTDVDSARRWTRVASDSFGYAIDPAVIISLVGRQGFHLYLSQDPSATQTDVASGLLLKTDRVAGIHMIGVPPDYRRRGYARQVMYGLLALARDLGCEHATLQASKAAKPLYEQLGFVSQGPLHSYRRAD